MKRIAIGKGIVEWVASRTNEYGRFGSDTAIGLQQKTSVGWETIAGVVYADWNGPNVVCHIAAKGKMWATRQYLWTIFDYPFNQLKVKRITVCVGEGNLPSRNFVEHLGFSYGTTLGPDSHPTGELLAYWMFRKDCRWICPDFYKPLDKAA